MSNNDKWGALSMRDRAFLIREGVRSGITDVGSIKEMYNHRFDGESNTSNSGKLKGFIKNTAYNIGSMPSVKDKGSANFGEILEGITTTLRGERPYKYDDLEAFMGNPSDYYRETSDTRGPQFHNTLNKKRNLGKTIKTYEGNINPQNEYVVSKEDYNRFKQMAADGKIFYGNADMENLNFISDSGDAVYFNSNRDDVQNYPIEFVLDGDTLYANAADLYDFTGLQGKLLSTQGTPYIRRQNRIPVRAVDLPLKYLNNEYLSQEASGELTDDMKRARNMSLVLRKRIQEDNSFKNRAKRFLQEKIFSEGGDLESLLSKSYSTSEINSNEHEITIPYKYTYPTKDLGRKLTKKNSVKDYVDLMYPIMQQEMAKNGYPMTNIDNVMRQMAQESNYGRDTRGNGFNYAGIKATGADKKEVGTKYSDGEYYMNFENNADFANWYLDLLNDRYDALNATSSQDYINRLHDGPYKYSKDKKGYSRNFRRMKTLDNILKTREK